MTINKTLVYKKIPQASLVAGEHIVVEDLEIDLDTVPKNGLIVEILYVSLDPYLRIMMRDPKIKYNIDPFPVGSAVIETAVVKILKSDADGFVAGETILANVPIAQYARIESLKDAELQRIDNPHGLPLAHFLGALGMPGLTAYSGLYEVGKPKAGETIFISSAAGAVGQVVGQIAKREGLTVIGSVGSDEKLKFITEELGFDAGFNYKKESPHDAIPRLAPDGLDIYYENVGGDHLEASLVNMKRHGRIVVCGMITTYGIPPLEQKPIRGLGQLDACQIKMQGFLVWDAEYGPAYHQEHQKRVQGWIHEGSFQAKLDVTEGIENAATSLVGMLEGKNFGKPVLKVK
ncbi:unnamed protein product [Clonostachys byssicola]|uniref:Dehydrogenase FUB6 n=1 Tax=Clonostachys byssicola TaxID=160290 RepID=A0A9N9Y009_9HYPO|nr:unnamed protein product [Clonostachys byssicola]